MRKYLNSYQFLKLSDKNNSQINFFIINAFLEKN
jgi:hypothetical protein